MNYQSDSFSANNMRCSNAVGGGVNLEYGITGVLSGLNTMNQRKGYRCLCSYSYTARQT